MITYKDIVKDNDPILRKKSVEVKLPLSNEDRSILEDMLEYVLNSRDEELAQKYNLRPAVGIAAPQLGVLKRMCAIVVDMGDEKEEKLVKYALVNPKIISHSVQKTYLKDGEGCLSVESIHKGYVKRAARITVKGYDILQEKEIEIRARGYLAIVFQHELDHFEGTLFYDRINKNNPFLEDKDALVIE